MDWVISSGLKGLGPFQLVESLDKGYVYIRANRLMRGLWIEISQTVIWRFALSNVLGDWPSRMWLKQYNFFYFLFLFPISFTI
jgi:hypothetical protein